MTAMALHKRVLLYQRNELTEHHLYRRLAALVSSPHNKRVLEDIAADELRHYQEWRRSIGSIVLGLKAALIELTGSLAGLTLALRRRPDGTRGAPHRH